MSGSMPYEEDMCPNCVTPWKCNGPHLETRRDAERRRSVNRAETERRYQEHLRLGPINCGCGMCSKVKA